MYALHSRHTKMVFTSFTSFLHPCRMQEWGGPFLHWYPWSPAVWSKTAHFLWFLSETPSAVFPVDIYILCISLGLPRENKGWLFLLWLICITCCPDVSAILDLYLATSLKCNKMEPGFVLGPVLPPASLMRPSLLTEACCCVLLIDQSLINWMDE